MIASRTTITRSDNSNWQEGFLAILPLIERQARAAFRTFDAESREDAAAEVIANAMCAYHRLHVRGELQRAFPVSLTRYAIAQYFSGRRVGASQKSGDLLSANIKSKSRCNPRGLRDANASECLWQDALVDNRRTTIPAQVAFRLDFPRWLGRLTPRDRWAAERLALGYSTSEVAQELSVSSGRISQLRRELAESWYAFTSASSTNAERNEEESLE